MLNGEQMAEAMNAISDQVEMLMREHENEEHGGTYCGGNRASAVAFLAHRLGVRGAVWDYAHQVLAVYDAECPGCNAHKKPPEGTPQ